MAQKKGKSKGKVISEEEDDEMEQEKKEKQDKITAALAAEHRCGIREHKTGWCWVRNDGQHIQLQRKDLSTWALWIVRYFRLPATSLLI